MTVSKSKINSGDLFEALKFAFLADTENFKKAFEKFGFTVNSEADLKTLADLSKSGADKSGKLVIEGRKIIFDVEQTMRGVDIRWNKINEANMSQYLVD